MPDTTEPIIIQAVERRGYKEQAPSGGPDAATGKAEAHLMLVMLLFTLSISAIAIGPSGVDTKNPFRSVYPPMAFEFKLQAGELRQRALTPPSVW